MRSLHFAALLCLLPLASACTFVRPALKIPAAAAPSKTNGYVGGSFNKDTFVGFGFVVRDEKSQQEYVLEVVDKELGAIAVPAGTYRVASWLTWALTTEQLTRKDLPAANPLARPFTLEPGQVVLLGHWSADRQFGFGSNTYTIVPKKVTEAELVKAFREAYPRFTEAKISCLLCLP